MNNITLLIGRILAGQFFLLAGVNKISAYAGTQGYMEAMGVPGMLLPVVILLEVVGGLALIIGMKTQWVSYALAAFTLAAAFIFHFNFGDQMQMIMFMKNIAITGGLLVLSAAGAGQISMDAKRAH